MKNVKIGLLVLGAALILAGAGCSRTKEAAPSGISPEETPSEEPQNPAVPEGQVGGEPVTGAEGVVTSEVPAPEVTGVSEATVEGGTGTEASGAEAQSLTITARRWEFQPSTITVKKGTRVKLSITSVDVAHGFGLPEFGINQTIEPGKTAEVDFVADKVGEFPFSCTVFCGEGHGGMKGRFVVEE